MSLNPVQIKIMLDLQNSMNNKVHSSWQTQGFEWYRAIWVECAELMDHFGWKWWKKQLPDTEQVALELIDIWHFGLSILLQSGTEQELLVAQIQSQLVIEKNDNDFRLDLENFVAATLSDRQFHVDLFGRLMAGIDMSFDQLYRGYVGKNVLNFFRQDHGYKTGTYIKEWHGEEDNVHLMRILGEIDAASPQFKEEVYDSLKVIYETL